MEREKIRIRHTSAATFGKDNRSKKNGKKYGLERHSERKKSNKIDVTTAMVRKQIFTKKNGKKLGLERHSEREKVRISQTFRMSNVKMCVKLLNICIEYSNYICG